MNDESTPATRSSTGPPVVATRTTSPAGTVDITGTSGSGLADPAMGHTGGGREGEENGRNQPATAAAREDLHDHTRHRLAPLWSPEGTKGCDRKHGSHRAEHPVTRGPGCTSEETVEQDQAFRRRGSHGLAFGITRTVSPA
jgi:hypothetical protein